MSEQNDEIEQLDNQDEQNERASSPLVAESYAATSGPTVSGIYQIRNLQTGRIYIGRSRNIHTRWLSHRDALNRGVHINENLQSDWEAFGERAFEFTVLEELVGLEALIQAEGRYLATVTNPYNTQPVPYYPEARQPILEADETSEDHFRVIAQFIEEVFFVRMRIDYQVLGYSDAWIYRHLRGVLAHEALIYEWWQRGVTKGWQVAILTDTLSEETFDVSTAGHREVKHLGPGHDLRDSLNGMEQALTLLGEEASKGLHQAHDSQGFDELRADSRAAGRLAGAARREYEAMTGRKVVSSENYKTLRQARQRELQSPLFSNAADETPVA